MFNDQSVKKFMAIFTSYDKAYGRFEINATRADGKQEGRAVTVKEPPTFEHIRGHLQGNGTGIGLLPLLEDNTCRWGCIDIDEIGIDHVKLEQKARECELPVFVFRSKSGGAHVMVFTNVPVPAVRMQRTLELWTKELGYPGVEIFPKQTKRKDGQVGNWLNMPYYNAEDTTRYAIFDGKPLTLEEFLGLIDKGAALNACDIDKHFLPENDGPDVSYAAADDPDISDEGVGLIPEGERHNELMRIIVSLRKQGYDDASLQAAALHAGRNRCQPAMQDDEIQDIVRWVLGNVDAGCSFYPLTDQGNGYRFSDRYNETVSYCYPMKRFYVWDGKRYRPDEHGQAVKMAKATALSIEDEAKAAAVMGDNDKILRKHAKGTQSKRGLESMLWAAQSEMAIDPEMFDADPFMLNVNNGVFDLNTGKLLPHEPTRYITKLAPVPYESKAECPQFLAFMNTIFDGDQSLIDYMQRVIGYLLTGSISEHCMFILWGAGRNGKSTLLNILAELLGDYHIKSEAKSFMVQRNEGIRNDIAGLKGARLVAASEISEGARLNEALVKELTGGDRVRTRFLYREFFEYTPQFKIMMAVNHKPEIRGIDRGIWSRIRLIPFTVSIPKAKCDKNLGEKLRAELPGILNWAIEGLKQWQKGGLQEPQVILDWLESYRHEMNVVNRFLSDETYAKSSAHVGASELFESFKEWCDAEGEAYLSQKEFGKRMTEMDYQRGKRTINGKSAKAYLGLDFKFRRAENENPGHVVNIKGKQGGDDQPW